MDEDDLKAAIGEFQAKGITMKIKAEITEIEKDVEIQEEEVKEPKTVDIQETVSVDAEPEKQPEEDDFDNINIMDELKKSIMEVEKAMEPNNSDSDDEDEKKEEEIPDKKDKKEQKPLKDFKFADLFSSVENKINQSEVALKPKDLWTSQAYESLHEQESCQYDGQLWQKENCRRSWR